MERNEDKSQEPVRRGRDPDCHSRDSGRHGRDPDCQSRRSGSQSLKSYHRSRGLERHGRDSGRRSVGLDRRSRSREPDRRNLELRHSRDRDRRSGGSSHRSQGPDRLIREPDRQSQEPDRRSREKDRRSREKYRRSREKDDRSRRPAQRRLTTPMSPAGSRSRSPQRGRSHAEQRDVAGDFKRSRSPSFSKRDFIDFLNCMKSGMSSQPNTQTAQPFQKLDHKNVLPNFDPASKNQRIDVWLKKVNECASVYGWDDRTTTHFAMQKLQGLAKTWYEGLGSILFSWKEWQDKLETAFPYEQNYGQALEEMLKRKTRFNEPIEVYYYEKLALLNQCDITDKRAVDCIIHGIVDKTLRSGALALRCTQPDILLKYLVSNKDSHQNAADRMPFRNKNSDNNNSTSNTNHSRPNNRTGPSLGCYNCKEKGHSFLHCPKPLLKCTKCNRVGHVAENCQTKPDNKSANQGSGSNLQKTMRIDVAKPDSMNSSSKFTKQALVNGVTLQTFVDFGSEVTLIRESAAHDLGLSHNNTPSFMKGFGNGVVQSLGELSLDISIDGVQAQVSCKVVSDELLESPMLVGQSYTEQPHIVVYKNVTKLQFLDDGNRMPCSGMDIVSSCALKVKTTGDVNLYGAASIRAQTDSTDNGSVLIKNSITGEPSRQFFVCGGVYSLKNGRLDVTVMPCSSFCQISKDFMFSRAERIDSIKRVVIQAAEMVSADEKKFCTDEVRVGPAVTDEEKQRLLDLLDRYKHCFASSLKELGCTNVTEMNIELNSQRPVVYRPYRLSHHEREKVRGMVDDMLEAGIVRQSASEYASPILLVRKKDGTMRMCIDYRMLNSVTIKERYPMPIIEDEIARLSGQACFITLDLASGYYQVPISERSRHLTSFVTPDGQYEFNRMPFGLANAPAVFQRMMNSVLGSARYSKATAYIDDVLIYGKDPTECLIHLEEVLQLIEKANLTLNLSKCDFLQDKIDYLGYEISSAGVRPGEKKIVSVANFPRPKDVHNVRQFLGLAGYFRKFVKNFAQIAYPLSKLLKKDSVWEWGQSQEKAFEDLKNRLTGRPILSIYNPLAETEVHTDASKVGVGGILLQRSSDGVFRPIAYYSRQTSPEEKNFHSYELETLAVICSLRKFRVYLLGKEFKIVTDCSALRSTFSKRDLIPRIARWWLQLQEFDCSIEYRAGSRMAHVDALSRNPVPDVDDTIVDRIPMVMAITDEDWLHTLQLGDSELCRVRNILTSELDEKGLRYIRENYVIKDNKLFRCIGGDQENVRWVVPKGARWQLCRMNHDDIGHFGVEKTLERIKKSYWFPKMSRFVKKYINACIECAYAKNNASSREGLLHPIAKVDKPFHTVHVDHLGPFVKSKRGLSYIFVVVDGFTKFCFIRAVRNTKTQNVVKVLEDICSTFRTPERLVSDRGSCFTSHAFKRFCIDKGIKHVLNAVASPRSNGQVERYNRTIMDSLKAFTMKYGEKEWDKQLGKIQWGLNNTVQKTTGRTPSEVLFGTGMNSEVNPILNEISAELHDSNISSIREEVKERIDTEQIKQKRLYDKGRKPAHVYKEGELVKLTKTCFNNDGQSKKLMPSFIGPYRVTKVLGKDRYKVAPVPGLNSTKTKRPTTVAADRMKPWIHVAALQVNEDDSDVSSENEATAND